MQPEWTYHRDCFRDSGGSITLQFTDRVTGATVYINPDYVMSIRPDPAEPDSASIVKIRDGETIHVQGAHGEVARKLLRRAA